MRLCRYDDDRLGLVRGEEVLDVTAALEAIPQQRWPLRQGDPLIANLAAVRAAAEALAPRAPRKPLSAVALRAPVPNPSKTIGAPANYLKHVAEVRADAQLHFGRDMKTIEHYGLFLKANSALVGPAEGVALRFPERRTDHEVELVVVIGRECAEAPRERALEAVAGYCIGLDMTVRGLEERALRKSIDGYAVLGPWLVTADEIADPDRLRLSLTVNGEPRQDASTAEMIFDVRGLIAYASRFYRLLPGDLIYTGTPEGVGPVKPGDVMHCALEGIGAMDVRVRAH
jgi:2,4-didehydro-3-deoxy-L-rhamnonate hydrolase